MPNSGGAATYRTRLRANGTNLTCVIAPTPMRILWICGSRIVGGAERVTIQIAGVLQARGHRFEALIPPTSALELVLDEAGIAFTQGVIGGSLNLRAPFAIRRALRKVAPDIALITTSDE
jgi:hypothetical protein